MSLCQCSFVCVDVIRSFTYVLRVAIWTSLKDVVRQGERKREAISTASRKRKEKNKIGISGCGSFVVLYFQPATSIDRLHTDGR